MHNSITGSHWTTSLLFSLTQELLACWNAQLRLRHQTNRLCHSFVEDCHLQSVPGTGLLSDQGVVRGHAIAIDKAKGLKRGIGKHAHVVLIPQPSDDPRDPYVVPTLLSRWYSLLEV